MARSLVRSFVAFISVRRHRRQQWKRREERQTTFDKREEESKRRRVATFLLGCPIDRLVPIRRKSQKLIPSHSYNGMFWGQIKFLHGLANQGCQMAKLDPFLSLDCTRVEGIKFCSAA